MARWCSLVVVAAGALAVVGCGDESSSEAGPPRLRRAYSRAAGSPSAVLVTVDTTRADHLSMYGNHSVETPNLHALAHSGVVFDAAMAVAPITLPSHTSILTGLYPPQHGVRNNGIHRAGEELLTLAEYFRDAGATTAAFVSAAVLERRYGLDQGFELYDDDLSGGRLRFERMVPDRPAEVTVSAALQWLDSLPPEQRFFLWVHLYDPHAAYAPPPPFADRYRGRPYDGEIAYMDSELGRFFDHPRVASIDDTILTVIGDHGESLGEHGENTHALLAYEATLHVPWILRAPGLEGKVHASPAVSQVDLLPTLLDLAGLETRAEVDGRSLVPLLEARQQGWMTRSLYGESWLPFYTYGWAKLTVLRQGRWKLIDSPAPEIFDLGRDPGELSNLAEHRPDRLHELQRAATELRASWQDPDLESGLVNDSEGLAQLQALGYLAVDGMVAAGDGPRPDPKMMIGHHVLLERARALARDRLYDRSAQVLERALEQDPTNLAALLDLARVRQATAQVEPAREALERALAVAPESATVRLARANLELAAGQAEQAQALVELVLEGQPQNLEARLLEARMHVHREPDEGRRLLAEILADHPQVPRVLVAHARSVDLPTGEVEAGRSRVSLALDRDPFHVPARLLLAELEEASGELAVATELYREGLRRQPDEPQLHARLGLLLARTGGGRQAEAHLREALRLSATDLPEVRTSLGAVLAQQGRADEASAQYDRVLADSPRHPAARNNRAIALFRRGDVHGARDEWRSLVEEYPRFADAHNNLAAAAVELGDWSEAQRHSRRALDLDPSLMEAGNNLGIALHQLGHDAEAVGVLRALVEREPEYWPAKSNLADVLIDRGQAAEAAALLEQVVDAAPGELRAYRQLADLYAGPLDEPALARKLYNAYLRRVPSAPDSAEIRRRVAALED